MDKLKQIIAQKRDETTLPPQPNSHELVNKFITGDMVLSKEERKLLWKPNQLEKKSVIYQGMPNKTVLNAYREIRTKLLRKTGGSSSIILVTNLSNAKVSSKNNVAFNLAASFAMDTSKTSIFVDCNPYTKDRQDLAIRGFQVGLTDHLKNTKISLADATYPSGVEHLKIIPTGENEDTAAEFFNNPRLGGIFNEIKYSLPHVFIFIDTPPVLHYSEAAILADIADLAVLVVPPKSATNGKIKDAVDRLGHNKIAGIIFDQNKS